MDLIDANRQLLAMEAHARERHIAADPEALAELETAIHALRARMRAFIKTERARGKTYGSWSAKEWIPNRPQ